MIILDPISPVAFSVLGFPVRWYAIAYIIAFISGYVILRKIGKSKHAELALSKKELDDLLTAVILGVIIGGRLGYVLFYNLPYFLAHPIDILAVWHGGMSFHGGLVGVIVAAVIFAKKWRRALQVLDLIALVAPIGFFFGRIANFINIEIMGRPTDSSVGVFFRGVSDVPRHASPLYEATTEGI